MTAQSRSGMPADAAPPARIGYLLKKFPRLSETFVLNEILGQERLGMDVHVFSRRSPDPEPTQPQLARLRAQVEVLPPASQIDAWQELLESEDDQLLPLVREVLHELRPLRHPRLPSLMAEAIHLRGRARELGLEHLHVHFATDAALVALVASRLGGPSYSLTAHAKDIYRESVDGRILAAMIRGAAFTVTVCEANMEHLRELIGRSDLGGVRRLYNGIDLELFEPPTAPREPLHVLSVGRLVEKKGFDVLIDALGLLEQQGLGVRATIVGDGEDRAALEARARASAAAHAIAFTGALDQEQVRRLLREATLFCLPCRLANDGNRDALPTVLLEALACGLPCVSTPVTGIPEILGADAGVLVPAGDPAATAAAMRALLADAPRRASIAQAGRLRAQRLFDARNAAATLNGWFRQALAGRSRRCA